MKRECEGKMGDRRETRRERAKSRGETEKKQMERRENREESMVGETEV